MSKGIYIGIDGKARKVKKLYVGVDGKARKVKKGYVGVNGVARLFYSGGGSGLLPSGYTELEYALVQYNAAYNTYAQLETGISCSSNSRIVFDIKFDVTPSYSSSQAYYEDLIRTGIRLTAKKSNIQASGSPELYYVSDVATSINVNTHRVAIDLDLQSLTISVTDLDVDQYDSGKYSQDTFSDTSFTIGNEFKMFYTYDYASGSNKIQLRVYDIKIYDGSVLVQHLIPCKNPSNVVGFFDVVGMKFIRSASSANFAAGPEA